MINALLFERPIWFSTGPLQVEEAQEMEDFTYHRPVLVTESVELLAPRAGSLVVDGTCGGGGHTAEILRAGKEQQRAGISQERAVAGAGASVAACPGGRRPNEVRRRRPHPRPR